MSEHGGDIYRNKVDIDYSVNVSPFGVPPMVRAAINRAVTEISTYPDPLYEGLLEAIGESDGVEASQVICGNGASELIFAVAKAIGKLVGEDKRAAMLIPCFLEYEKAFNVAGFEDVTKVLLLEENEFLPGESDADKLVENAKILMLGNPNNPTGRLLPKQWVKELLKKAEKKDVYVILDETFLPLTEKFDDYEDLHSKFLIRIRAYTKSMAIPGIRLGYLICENEGLLEEVKKQLPDWNVSLVASEAGIACAKSKKWLEDQLMDSKNGLAALRERLCSRLESEGIKTFSSDTGFVLLKSERNLYEEYLKKGILIRDCSNFEGLSEGFYRMAVRNELEKERLLSVKPAEIEKTSFKILSSELEAKGTVLEGEEALVIKRCIHTTADFEYATTLTFSDNAVARMKSLIREGACIVTDTNMALSGINKSELAKYGGEAFCFMADPEIARVAKERGCTRATASMEHAAGLGRKIIFVVGNAPTALVTLCEMMDKGTFTPDFVVGVPVGFVNVEQAKEMVMNRKLNYIVNRGRKGGSNVAAAIVNAVLYEMRDE